MAALMSIPYGFNSPHISDLISSERYKKGNGICVDTKPPSASFSFRGV